MCICSQSLQVQLVACKSPVIKKRSVCTCIHHSTVFWHEEPSSLAHALTVKALAMRVEIMYTFTEINWKSELEIRNQIARQEIRNLILY